MTGRERRLELMGELQRAASPVSGSALARALGVSRQVIVQDIALLRANGHDVVATARGYVLREGAVAELPTRLVKVHHTVDDVEDELNTIVDLGGAVTNVMVNHRVYGKITADLDVRNRRDVARYIKGIETGKSFPLMTVTSLKLMVASFASSYSFSPSSHMMIIPFEPSPKLFSNSVSSTRVVFPLSINPVNKYTGISCAIIALLTFLLGFTAF